MPSNELKRKMINRIISIVFLLTCFIFTSFSQSNYETASILFYNVENLFDTVNDPQTEDDNYTPEGELHWTSKRLNKKLLNISKVILSSSGWKVPDVVAMCEVENRKVLEKLIGETPLKSVPYKIIHKESPDHRGIDVAFIYNSDNFYPLVYHHYPLSNDEGAEIKTREILYVEGIINGRDTIHFFVNHWPSRYSGLLETKSLRNEAAALLRGKVDELLREKITPKIVILGDFNDNPSDESITDILKAKQLPAEISPGGLYNLSSGWIKNETGTLKFQSQWFFFDQIIVSGSLLNSNTGLATSVENASVNSSPFLLERDKKYGGFKPRRTYYGFTYNEGFSDHLPVLLKLDFKD